jgi:hypothetical protein
VSLTHDPGTSDALHSKEQRLAAIDSIDRIDNRHKSGLSFVLHERVIAEQIGLHGIYMRTKRQAARITLFEHVLDTGHENDSETGEV